MSLRASADWPNKSCPTADDLLEHLDHFDLSPLDERVLEKGIELVNHHALRAADAIHLAAAILLARDLGRRQMRFTTVDTEQAKAASAEGLRVIRLD